MWVVARHAGAAIDGFPTWIGWVVMGAAMAIALWSAATFLKARTPLEPGREPSTLLRNGPFAYSRNPIYSAMTLLLSGWALALGAPLTLVFPIIFAWIILNRFIRWEEAMAESRFPDEWGDYTSKVRRWF